MIEDRSIRQLHDFPETSDCFPGLNIRGGVCYFLWDRDYDGPCEIFNYKRGIVQSKSRRFLKEHDLTTFVRYNKAMSILQKVRDVQEETFATLVSSRKPFGLDSNFSEFADKRSDDKPIVLYRVGGVGFIRQNQIAKMIGWWIL